MTNVNLIEAGSDLSKLIKMLENKEEDIIYIIQNGVRVAQLTAVPKKISSKRIGVAAGKFTVPEDFDDMDKDIEELFEDYLQDEYFVGHTYRFMDAFRCSGSFVKS